MPPTHRQYFDAGGNNSQDVRASCPESHLAARNAKVLCPNGLVERDTEFYQKVQEFRNERDVKNQLSAVGVKLYIPGRIIHLVDTKGDEAKYVPYWASRYEFNQVILSSRMIADHAMPPLVDILRTLNLDDIHEVNAWIDDKTEETEDEEVRLVIPCSNPQGRFPLILLAMSIVTCILVVLTNQGCKYMARSSVISPPDGGESSYPGRGLNVGLWNYNLKQCIDEDGFNTTDACVDSDYCQPYPGMFVPDIYWKSARVFGTLSVLLGFVGILLVSMATCTKLKKRTWMLNCSVFLLAALFEGLQFIFVQSDICTTWMNPENGNLVTSECSLSTAGKLGVACTVLHFITAVGCARMARMA